MKLILLTDLVERFFIRTVVLTCVAWLPLVLLSMVEGTLFTGVDIPFLKDVVPNARCLLIIPLLSLVGVFIVPILANVDKYMNTSGIIADDELSVYSQYVNQRSELADANWMNLVLLISAFIAGWLMKEDYTELFNLHNLSSWAIYVSDTTTESSLAGLWFAYISIPVASFLLYKWLWRFFVWCFFLFRVSRLNLQLQATHSDLSGGLGVIGNAQNMFGVLFMAMAILTSAALANELIYERAQLADVKLFVFIYLFLSVIFINAPLLVFSGKLFKLKRQALMQYSILQCHSSKDFHKHWIIDKHKNMVDSMQPSALADYSAVYEIVNSIRLIPLNPRGVVVMVSLILTPFLLLVFTQSSIREVILEIGGSVL